MPWPLAAITKLLKNIYAKIRGNKITTASVAVFLALIIRKITRSKGMTSEQAKVVLENISAFYEKLRQNKVKSVSILNNVISYEDVASNIFQASLPKHAQSALQSALIQNNVDFKYVAASAVKSSSKDLLLIFISWSIIGFLFYSVFFADSPEMTTSSKPQKTITFKDVVGLEEQKQSLREIIEYMKDPKKFQDIGARMRRGIIFYGPSGTGKTTMAKATAGEAEVPFFSCNASQFCEMYVGVGPRRVRELFKKAKEQAPSIVYIDEIDAIGNRKQTGIFNQGANSEKNSTINQLLSQMDGFASQENVLVIGSTNRLQMIDQSLLRAGRFDLKIKISLPNANDRYQILKHHLNGKTHTCSNTFLMELTEKLNQWSGADLQNLANESVYASLRYQSKQISPQILSETAKKLSQQLHH